MLAHNALRGRSLGVYRRDECFRRAALLAAGKKMPPGETRRRPMRRDEKTGLTVPDGALPARRRSESSGTHLDVLGQRTFHLFQCLGLDLPDALGRDAKFVGQVMQRQATALIFVAQPARFNDPAASIIKV